MEKKQLHESRESAPLLATFLARRDYEAHHHLRRKMAVFCYHFHEPSAGKKTPNQPPPTADLQIFITLHRSDLSHSKDWMKSCDQNHLENHGATAPFFEVPNRWFFEADVSESN